jgi:hypothetical protein
MEWRYKSKQNYWANKDKFLAHIETKREYGHLPPGCFDFVSIHESAFGGFGLCASIAICTKHNHGQPTRPRWERKVFKTFDEAKTVAKSLAKRYSNLGVPTFVVNCRN